MNELIPRHAQATPTSGSLGAAPRAGFQRYRSAFERIDEQDYRKMLGVLECFGGVTGGDEFARRMRPHWDQPVSVLARWIVERRIVSFDWRSRIVIPLFQFDMSSADVLPVVSAAAHELRTVFDDWEVAMWFSQPNVWLAGAVPCSAVHTQPDDLVSAARADRFIARG